LLPPGALAFDIGAHVGNRARALRAAGARVVALEPQAPFAGFLRRTLPADITLIEAAAGARPGSATLAVSSLHPTVSSLAGLPDMAGTAAGFAHVRWDARQQVTVTTLDALIAAHGRPDFVKIDVEGHEAEVLAGLTRPLPLVAVEYLPQLPELAQAAVLRLAALGPCRFNHVPGEATGFAWAEWRSPEATLDWLAGLDAAAGSGDLYARAA
jgi:FkbM family methyltransferase